MGSKARDDLGSMLGQWNSLVRRARIGRDSKVAALTVSSYANADGSGIILSVARFAIDLEVSYSTARRYLRWLREVGLLDMVRAGNRRKGTASEYRLILGPDVMEHIEVLTPSRQKALADEMREAERAGTRSRTERMRTPDQRSSGVSVDNDADGPESEPVQRSPKTSVDSPINAQNGLDQRSPWMTHTPSRTHLSVEDLPSRADDEDLRTDVAVGGAPADSPKPDSPLKCVHKLSGATRPDGRPVCALCRVEQARALGVHRFAPQRPPPDPEPGRIATVIPLDSRRTS